MTSASRRQSRARLAVAAAAPHGGVALRRQLLAEGITSDEIRSEVRAGRWTRLGRHTIAVSTQEPVGAADPAARLWWAVWESGSGAALDGVSALVAAGLTGWTERAVHVSVPHGRRVHALPGVVLHRPRPWHRPCTAGLPRVPVPVALVRAAHWASSDRQAATLIAMTVQQRLVSTDRLLAHWTTVRRSTRRQLVDQVVRDVCDGAHSLSELDFAALCRRRGLPEPSRKVVVHGQGGRAYLDVWWDAFGVHVEIDGVQHTWGLAPVSDALRQNAVAVDGGVTLRIPVLGLRVAPEAFLDQVEATLRARGWGS
jgi:hypothetical protein